MTYFENIQPVHALDMRHNHQKCPVTLPLANMCFWIESCNYFIGGHKFSGAM